MVKKGIYFLGIFCILASCADKVKKYSGFTQGEMEFLLASDNVKIWERTRQESGGKEIIPDDCGMDNQLIFLQGSVGEPKPLIYVYNPLICDSLDFCELHPNFCQSDTALCNSDPELCALLEDGMLYIGSWYAKAPFITNDRSDTLVFEINAEKETIYVTNISSEHATFQYKKRKGSNGELITEYYHFLPPQTDQ